MAETQIGRMELTGWKAFVALARTLGGSGLGVYSRFQAVSDRGRGALREWQVKDYTGRGPKALAQRAVAQVSPCRVIHVQVISMM
jgi:hypothetical protein